MCEALDVLVLGELNPDVLVYGVDPPLSFGQAETVVTGAEVRLGSSGAITAAACQAAGLSAAICGVVGQDPIGDLTLGLLSDTGVDTTGVLVRDDVATGVTIVLNRDCGDRALLTHPGAMSSMRTSDVPAGLLARARHVHVSSLFLQRGLHQGLGELFRCLRTRGVTTSLDIGWDPAGQWSGVAELLPDLDYFMPNEVELMGVAEAMGIPRDAGQAWSTVAGVARQIAGSGATVVVKCGARGALLASVSHGWEIAATPVTPLDTTGAGDNFNAGFLFALSTGADPVAGLTAGAAAGALATTGRGGTGRMASAAELASARDAPRARQLW